MEQRFYSNTTDNTTVLKVMKSPKDTKLRKKILSYVAFQSSILFKEFSALGLHIMKCKKKMLNCYLFVTKLKVAVLIGIEYVCIHTNTENRYKNLKILLIILEKLQQCI